MKSNIINIYDDDDNDNDNDNEKVNEIARLTSEKNLVPFFM